MILRFPRKPRSDVPMGYSSKPRWMWMVALLPSAIALGQFRAIAATALPTSPTFSHSALLTENPPLIAQSPRVSDLSDISPTDWAFQAVQRFSENYGCLQGYPDRTFGGDRRLTRFEFAAELNACLAVMARLSAQQTIAPEDVAVLTRLRQEFQDERVELEARISALEAATTNPQIPQFSTTTRLRGQADFNLGLPFDRIAVFDDDNDPEVVESNVSIAARVRLNLDTSFTGDDRLRLRLQGRRGDFLDPFGGLADGGDGNYDIELTDVYYRFPLGDRIEITLSARGLQGSDWVTSTILPYDGPAVASAAAPGFYDSGGSSSNGAGLGISLDLTDDLAFDIGYTASNAGGATNPAIGLFAAANQSYIAQFTYLSDGVINAGLVYLHSDQADEFAGGQPGAVDTYAGLVSLDLGDFFIAGHAAYQVFNGGTDTSWTVGLGVDDFLLDGSQLGIYGGLLPQLEDYVNNPVLIEGYFQIPITPYLTITPALVYGEANLRNEGGTRTDDTSLYGVIRATFRF